MFAEMGSQNRHEKLDALHHERELALSGLSESSMPSQSHVFEYRLWPHLHGEMGKKSLNMGNRPALTLISITSPFIGAETLPALPGSPLSLEAF